MTSLIRQIKLEINCYFPLHMYEVILIVSNTIRTTEPSTRSEIYFDTFSFPNISVVLIYIKIYENYWDKKDIILTFVGPCIVIYFCSKTNQMHNISNIIYFGKTL
jgi:hypothetical protein